MNKRKISKKTITRGPIKQKKYPGESDPNVFVRVASRHVREKSAQVTLLLDEDNYLHVFDNALTAAEQEVEKLLPSFDHCAIAEAFKRHADTHLAMELSNIAAHGHRNEDPQDIPPIAPNSSKLIEFTKR